MNTGGDARIPTIPTSPQCLYSTYPPNPQLATSPAIRLPPAKVPRSLADVRKVRRREEGRTRFPTSSMSIRALIIDDSSVMRKIVERSLRQAGLDLSEVFQAGNGAEALSTLKDSPVDLILCDINMPVMDGIEFIKQLPGVENAKNVPVVMITTEGSEAHVVQALSCGARGYIRKPFTPEQVKEHVVPVLAGKL